MKRLAPAKSLIAILPVLLCLSAVATSEASNQSSHSPMPTADMQKKDLASEVFATARDEPTVLSDSHILNAPIGESEAVLYRSSALMTPVFRNGNTHDSREQSAASFKLSGADSGRVNFPALNKRYLGRTTVAVRASDLTIPLPTVRGLRVGESLQLRGRTTMPSEIMRIVAIDDATSTVTVAERHQAHGFSAPRAWPVQTSVYHHRRARPEPLPTYMADSGIKPVFKNFRFSWSGVDVPYLAMNLSFPGGDEELKDWQDLLVYLRLRRADGTGRSIEGILPMATDSEFPLDRRVPGNPYTLREQRLREHLGWPHGLTAGDSRGASEVAFVDDERRARQFYAQPEKTFLQEMIDWIYAEDGHDLGRIYPSDDRYHSSEFASLSARPESVAEELVHSYQIIVDVAFLDGTDPRIDSERFSVIPASSAVWNAVLTVGTETTTLPNAYGYSPWGVGIGRLATNQFELGGNSHTVHFLIQTAGGLYLGLDREIASDFTLHIGDSEFVAGDSKVSRSAAMANYWWDDSGLNLVPGEAVDVGLELNQLPSMSRQPAPPAARFYSFPDNHDGVNKFTFLLHFDEEFPLSYKTLQNHSLEVRGGTNLHVRRADRDSNREWWITIQPTSADDVSISLNRGQDCEAAHAICTADGRHLHNQPTLTVPGA